MPKNGKQSSASSRSDKKLSNPQSVYRFRGTLIGQLSSTSDVIAATITLDPSAYTEYADFSALFSEIRVVSSKLTLVPYVPYSVSNGGTVAQTTTGSAACGLNLGNTATAPASRPAVFSIPGSKPVSLTWPKPTVFTGKIPTMNWALVSAPVPGPFAGCYGSWDFYLSGVDASMVNAVQMEYYIENVYELRGRR